MSLHESHLARPSIPAGRGENAIEHGNANANATTALRRRSALTHTPASSSRNTVCPLTAPSPGREGAAGCVTSMRICIRTRMPFPGLEARNEWLWLPSSTALRALAPSRSVRPGGCGNRGYRVWIPRPGRLGAFSSLDARMATTAHGDLLPPSARLEARSSKCVGVMDIRQDTITRCSVAALVGRQQRTSFEGCRGSSLPSMVASAYDAFVARRGGSSASACQY